VSRRILDLPRTEPDLARALAGLDAGLRLALAAAWLAAAALGTPALIGSSPALAAALAACGVAALADVWPRASAVAGLAVSLLALPGGPALAPWLALLGAAAARVALQLGGAGALLERVRVLRRARATALAATEILRARAAALPDAAGSAELGRAGDAFELAGRARGALRELGVEGRVGPALARAAGRGAAALLPASADAALAARLVGASRSSCARVGLAV
jgi:hypothetical protein